QIRGLQLLELPKNVCRSGGVVSAEFQPSNDHPLPGHIMLDVRNLALGVGQAFLEQIPIQNSRRAAPPIVVGGSATVSQPVHDLKQTLATQVGSSAPIFCFEAPRTGI